MEASIRRLGFTPDEFHFPLVFNEWFNDLFKLNDQLNAEKFSTYLRRAKPHKSTPLVCVDVRMGGALELDLWDIRNLTRYYWSFVRDNFLNSLDTDNYRVFVSSDIESVEREARDELGGPERVVVIPDDVSNHIDGPDCSSFHKLVLDFWMLAHCDFALVSDTGYGIFGVMRNRMPPATSQQHHFYVLSSLEYVEPPVVMPLKQFIYSYPMRF